MRSKGAAISVLGRLGEGLRTWVVWPTLVGLAAKLGSVVIAATFAFAFDQVMLAADRAAEPISEQRYEWAYGPFDLIVVLILSPVIENLLIPLAIESTRKVTLGGWVGVPILCLAFFLLHGGGLHGLHGATGFLFFASYYILLRQRCSWSKAYMLTVAAHLVANTVSLLLSLN